MARLTSDQNPSDLYHPERFVIGGDRINEGHVSVRFGDHTAVPPWKVFLGQQDVTKDCYEAVAGEHGAVVMWVDGICCLVTGFVTTTKEMPEGSGVNGARVFGGQDHHDASQQIPGANRG